MEFEKLELRGIPVNIEKPMPNTLKKLKLDQLISVEDLRNFRNLSL